MNYVYKLNRTQKKKLDKMHKKLIWGSKHKKVFTYPDALIDALRPYHIGGLPASILVLINELCNGLCYDRSLLMSLAFDDAKIIHGNIETLRITSGEEFAEHSFVETKEFGGGKSWIIDTSSGLIYDKDFYFEHEKVSVNKEIPKEKIMNSYAVKSIIASNFEEDKYALPMYLPLIENAVMSSNWLHTTIYRDLIFKELEHFKKSIDYDAIKAEIDEDIHLMRTNPQKLDEKFQIIRDKYGREISRNGKPNPYYISPEESDDLERRHKEVFGDKQKEYEFNLELFNKSKSIMDAEEQQIIELANIRIEEILKNPTANFYDKQPSQTQPGEF